MRCLFIKGPNQVSAIPLEPTNLSVLTLKFEIKLPLFEGPFDLLLFFIQRDELDVYDIPISKITRDFLAYIKHLEKINVEVASEFILVASTLMRIKAKMLLPRPVLDEAGNEIDPREDLVRHLLEYKRYKSVIAELVQLESNRLAREKRGNLAKETRSFSELSNVEAELQNLDLFNILKVYKKVLQQYEMAKNKVEHKYCRLVYAKYFPTDMSLSRPQYNLPPLVKKDLSPW